MIETWDFSKYRILSLCGSIRMCIHTGWMDSIVLFWSLCHFHSNKCASIFKKCYHFELKMQYNILSKDTFYYLTYCLHANYLWLLVFLVLLLIYRFNIFINSYIKCWAQNTFFSVTFSWCINMWYDDYTICLRSIIHIFQPFQLIHMSTQHLSISC